MLYITNDCGNEPAWQSQITVDILPGGSTKAPWMMCVLSNISTIFYFLIFILTSFRVQTRVGWSGRFCSLWLLSIEMEIAASSKQTEKRKTNQTPLQNQAWRCPCANVN